MKLKKRWVVTAGVTALAAVLLIPVVLFGIIPLFVRSTLNEPPMVLSSSAPPASASSSEAIPTPSLHFAGDLRRIDRVHYGSRRRLTVLSTQWKGLPHSVNRPLRAASDSHWRQHRNRPRDRRRVGGCRGRRRRPLRHQ